MRALRSLARIALASVATTCASSTPKAPADAPPLTLSFAIDAPAAGQESYACFGFDASSLAGRYLRAVRWTAPSPGAIALHHGALYASPDAFPDGPVPCDAMPTAWTMHVWAPGDDPLVLPASAAIALPAGTRRFIVQAHVLETASGPATTATVSLETTAATPAHVARWLSAAGGVPALRPHMQDRSTTTCAAGAPMHVFTAWPHMHKLGKAFTSAVVRGDGSRTVLVDVPAWSFDHQTTYVVDADIAAGDRIETDCTWMNTTDGYVFAGLRTSDEMCGQGLIVWPAEADWASGCP